MSLNLKRYILVRHGESLANAGAPGAGHNPGLSKVGLRQAKEMAKFVAGEFSVDAILCSPFRRCVETAKPLAKATELEVSLEPLLQEFFNERWFGRDLRYLEFPSLPTLAQAHGWIGGTYTRHRWWPRVAERASDLDERLRRLVRFLSSPGFPGETIVCVGHWASVASMATALKPDISIPEVGNATVTVIEHHPQRNVVTYKDYDGFLSTPT